MSYVIVAGTLEAGLTFYAAPGGEEPWHLYDLAEEFAEARFGIGGFQIVTLIDPGDDNDLIGDEHESDDEFEDEIEDPDLVLDEDFEYDDDDDFDNSFDLDDVDFLDDDDDD